MRKALAARHKIDVAVRDEWSASSDDVDAEPGDELLQHMCEKISSGASSVDAALKDARAGFKDASKFFKGKTIKSLMRFKPGNSARDFFKTIKLPLEPTLVKVPVWEFVAGEWKHASTTVPVLDIHEILSYVHCDLGVQTPPELVTEYWTHLCKHNVPFAVNHPSTHYDATDPRRHSHIPFSLYGDECNLSFDGKEKVTAMFVSLTLFRPKEVRLGQFMVFCMKDACMVHENLASLTPILNHMAWSSNIAFEGKFPAVGPSGQALSASKMKRAGGLLAHGRVFAAAELKGDWKFHERSLRLLHTPTSRKCCLFCGAEASDESPLRYYGDSWVSTIATTPQFLLHKVREGRLSPLTFLRGFDISMVKFCSMHVNNLGLTLTANGGAMKVLMDAGVWGDATTLSEEQLLDTAFQDFKRWRLAKRVPCSQKRFRPSQLKKKLHGYYFTAKAYNSRVILQWLSEKCADQAAAADPQSDMGIHAVALSSYAEWYTRLEAAPRFLTESDADKLHKAGNRFLRCHRVLTERAHRSGVLSWVMKPKFHAMSHLLREIRLWRLNVRYYHNFAGEDSMGWVKRTALKSPRGNDNLSRWMVKMGMLKLWASKKKLTRAKIAAGFKR